MGATLIPEFPKVTSNVAKDLETLSSSLKEAEAKARNDLIVSLRKSWKNPINDWKVEYSDVRHVTEDYDSVTFHFARPNDVQLQVVFSSKYYEWTKRIFQGHAVDENLTPDIGETVQVIVWKSEADMSCNFDKTRSRILAKEIARSGLLSKMIAFENDGVSKGTQAMVALNGTF